MFSLICARINGWVNNGEAGDLRRNRAHYDVTVMHCLLAIATFNVDCSASKVYKMNRRPRSCYMFCILNILYSLVKFWFIRTQAWYHKTYMIWKMQIDIGLHHALRFIVLTATIYNDLFLSKHNEAFQLSYPLSILFFNPNFHFTIHLILSSMWHFLSAANIRIIWFFICIPSNAINAFNHCNATLQYLLPLWTNSIHEAYFHCVSDDIKEKSPIITETS